MPVMKLMDKALALAEQRGLRQADLARACAIEPSRISEWKKDKGSGPSLQVALRMARALGVLLDYLADDAMDVPPKPLTAQQQAILETIEARNLDYRAVIRRLTADQLTIEPEPPKPREGRKKGS